MDYNQLSAVKGADVFLFDYAHLDVVYSVALGSGSWGLYKADGTVAVRDTLTPQIGIDGVTSQPGTFTTSITLAQLSSYTSARVHYDGQGFTLDYTLDNGTTWTSLGEDGVIPLPANADLDLRVSFPGNIANDTAVVNSLVVYVLGTETLKSKMDVRTMTATNAQVTNGTLIVTTTADVAAANATPTDNTLDPADYSIGTIEMWVTPGTNDIISGPAHTLYTNGVPGAPLAGIRQHVVAVLSAAANTEFTVLPGTVETLAVYPQVMTAGEVSALYIAQTAGATISITDASVITLTESSPATDIYAYAWQIQSGGS